MKNSTRSRLKGGGLAFAVLIGIPLLRAHAASLAVAPQHLTSQHASSAVPTTTCTLAPASDTYVDEAVSISNYGTATSLHIRSEAVANRRTLLQFDLSACSIPSSSAITAATLALTLQSPPASSRTYAVHRVTAPWTETAATWDTQPTAAASPTSSASTGTLAGSVIEWDVKADVEAFVQGTATNEGWRVQDDAEGGVAAVDSEVAAREHTTVSSRPLLTVNYYP